MSDNEAVTSEIVASAHIENYAMKLFEWADKEDRAARFGKNVVKSFYTAGNLFDVMQVFGELTPEILHARKYSKWKAAYIHNCLKNGETPIPGPVGGDKEDNEASEVAPGESGGSGGWAQPSGVDEVQDPSLRGARSLKQTSNRLCNSSPDNTLHNGDIAENFNWVLFKLISIFVKKVGKKETRRN